jgi:hypothetical protein
MPPVKPGIGYSFVHLLGGAVDGDIKTRRKANLPGADDILSFSQGQKPAHCRNEYRQTHSSTNKKYAVRFR